MCCGDPLSPVGSVEQIVLWVNWSSVAPNDRTIATGSNTWIAMAKSMTGNTDRIR